MQALRRSFFAKRPRAQLKLRKNHPNSSLALAAVLVLVADPIRFRSGWSSDWIEVVRKFKINKSTGQAVYVMPSLKL